MLPLSACWNLYPPVLTMLPLTVDKICKNMFFKKNQDLYIIEDLPITKRLNTYIHHPTKWGSSYQPSGDTSENYIWQPKTLHLHPRHSTGLELWHRCCPWWQLYLVTDLNSGFQNERKVIYTSSARQSCVYMQVGCFEGAYAYTRTFMQEKVRICWKIYLWTGVVSPWDLNLWFWTMVSR